MIKTTSLLLLLIPLLAIADQTTPSYGIRSKSPSKKAFINATITISPGVTIEDGKLVIENGRVVVSGKSIKIPDDAEVIDLDGYSIFPGFIDPFTEYGLEKTKKTRRNWGDKPQYEAERSAADAWNDAIHAERNAIDGFTIDKKESKELIKLGFTVVQSAKFDGIFRGRSFVTILGDGLTNDLILKADGHHFLSFNKGSSKQSYPTSLMGSIAIIRQTFLDAEWYQSAHAAFTLDQNQKRPEFNSSLEALSEFKNFRYIFETENDKSLLRADRIAKEYNLDFVHVGSGYEYARSNEIEKTATKLIIPLKFPSPPDVSSEADDLDFSLAQLRHWELAPSNPAILEEKGIEFAITSTKLKKKSDFWPNIRKAIDRGLTVNTALASLTTIPASICGVEDLTGTLENGKLANFIVSDKDLFLSSEASIYSVWVNGEKHNLKERSIIDFRGTYEMKLDLDKFTLQLKGKKDKLSGSVLLDSLDYKLKKITTSSNEIKFTVNIDSISLPGVYRFTGNKYDNRITGQVADPSGSILNWSATVTKEFISETDSLLKGKTTYKPVSRLTHPNKSYGRLKKPDMQDLLITNATIWTSEEEGILEGYDLLIESGIITGVGKGLKVPNAEFVTIEGTGKHITAGIIDEHSHIAIDGNVNECSDAVTAEVRISDVVDPDDIAIYRQLGGGVTASQLLHGSCNPIGGQAQVIKLRWGATAEELKFKAAPPTIKFALGENVKHSNFGDKYVIRYPQTRMGVETIIKDEFQAAKEYEENWTSYRSLGRRQQSRSVPPRIDLELEAVRDIINSEMFIHCHSYHQTEILMLMRVAEEFNFKVQNFTHILEGYKVADEMAAHGATASAFSDWWAYKFEVYDAIPYNVALMSSKGVISSVNSDNADLARRLNLEAAKSIEYGDISKEEAIKLVTLNPAIQLKIDDRVGSIKVGKDADFVIWNGSPLSNYSLVEQTWIEGRLYFDRQEDMKIRDEIKSERAALIQKILDSGSNKDKSPPDRSDYKQEKELADCDDCYDFWRIIK